MVTVNITFKTHQVIKMEGWEYIFSFKGTTVLLL